MKRFLFPIFQFVSRTEQYPIVLKTYCGFKKISHIDFIEVPSQFDYDMEKSMQLFAAKQYREEL